MSLDNLIGINNLPRLQLWHLKVLFESVRVQNRLVRFLLEPSIVLFVMVRHCRLCVMTCDSLLLLKSHLLLVFEITDRRMNHRCLLLGVNFI